MLCRQANSVTFGRKILVLWAKTTWVVLLFLSAWLWSACATKTPSSTLEDPKVWSKIKIDFKRLDNEGLTGPPTGKVAANYEFCIPAEDKHWQTVHQIDKSATKQASRGRIGCGKDHWLIIGSTHQKNYKRVLYQLASLPYVQNIEETFFE